MTLTDGPPLRDVLNDHPSNPRRRDDFSVSGLHQRRPSCPRAFASERLFGRGSVRLAVIVRARRVHASAKSVSKHHWIGCVDTIIGYASFCEIP